MNEKEIQKFKDKLEEEKKTLRKELESFATEEKKPIKGDWNARYPKYDGDIESEADEVQEYEKLLSIEHSLEKRLADINLALDKIKDGNYGICENCQKQIDIERLNVCPEARACIECK